MLQRGQNTSVPSTCGSICFWSWNDALDKEEIKHQLQDFSKGRFSGVVIHARAGLKIPYMGEEWFRLYDVAVKEAGRLGMEVWIYDEDGWPSGFAGGLVPALGEEYCLKYLCISKEDTGSTDKQLAAWRLESGKWTRIAPEQAEKGDINCWYETDTHYVDLLSPFVVRKFIDFTHERYKQRLSPYFGTVIKGFFTDEPQLPTYPWSKTLSDAYREKYGEDLLDKLYLLVVEDDGWQRFRLNFRLLLSELFYSAFTRQNADWCADNGLMFTGHFSAEDGLCTQIGANGGVMAQYMAMQMPGIDYLGNRKTSPILLKQASSVARQMGKDDVLSETFGCTGWGIPFSQLCWIWGWQSVLGITKPCFHLAAYSILGRRKRDYPTFFSYQEPWWPQFPALTQWIDNLNVSMKEGNRAIDTLVISPIESVRALFNIDPDGGAMQRYSAQFRQLAENLLDIQLDFDIGDETVLATHATVEDGKFRVENAVYTTVIVSECLSLAVKTAHLLCEYGKQGGQIIYIGQHPEMINLQPWIFPKGVVLQNRREMLEKWANQPCVLRPVRVISLTDGKTVRGIVLHTRRLGFGLRIHIWSDEMLYGAETALLLDGNYQVFAIDIASGRRTLLPSVPTDICTTVKIQLQPQCNYMIEAVTETNGKTADTMTQDPKKIRSWTAKNMQVRRCDDNCLTIDQASVSINGGPFSKPMALIHMLDMLYEQQNLLLSGQNTEVLIRYSFDCPSDWVPQKLKVAVEDKAVEEITVNNMRLIAPRQGWWIDQCIGEYDITALTYPGHNTVTLKYSLTPVKNGLETTQGFETERNRFYYPVEPDNIYLRGDFDVLPFGKSNKQFHYYKVENRGFELRPPTEKNPEADLTAQGMWFYRGNAAYSFRVNGPEENRRIVMRIDSVKGSLVQWSVGGKEGTLLMPPFEQDITDYLKRGENEVCVCLIGTNRNLLGPHHHINGDNIFVGPSIFSGRCGFEDFVTPWLESDNTWSDTYGFVPYGCIGISLIELIEFEGRSDMV